MHTSFRSLALFLAIAVTGACLAVAQDANVEVERGRYLATAGNCTSCHTAPGGAEMAGGVAFVTDFGTIYSTNITSDPTAGIGAWTYEQFARAMREGIAADGRHLYPAFPYPSFAKINDADMKALYAYFKTVPPAPTKPPENQMSFPFNQRGLMAMWNALFFDGAEFVPDPQQSDAWNRGAYLVQGLGHCGACHTPRNFLGAEDTSRAFSGGTLNDRVARNKVRTWTAVNLTSAQSGLAAWSEQDVFDYLKTGHGAHGASSGPMNEVIGNSTRHLTDEDVRAMAVYIKSLPPIETSPQHELSADERRRGETLYTIHCGTCHLPTGLGSTPGSELGPPLVGSAIAQAADPATLINSILYGREILPGSQAPDHWTNMKPLGNVLSDADVAAIATYVRGNWGNRGGPVTAEQVAKQR